MYYYLLEPPRNRWARWRQEKIKRLLGRLGIAGETAVPSPARNIEELIKLSLVKGYSTIVGIGSEVFFAQLIKSLPDQLEQSAAAFGFIPLQASEKIERLIGSQTIEEAAEALKQRHLKPLSLGLIQPQKYFWLPVFTLTEAPQRIKLTVDGLVFEATVTHLFLEVSDRLDLIFWNREEDPHPLVKFGAWLVNRRLQETHISRLRGREIKIESEKTLPLILETEIVAKTPVSIRLIDKALQIISSRRKVKEESMRREARNR